jgi:histidyl-tRNA synthetase
MNMSDIISPKVLKGFRDSLPEQEIPKKALVRKLEDAFSLFGYVPIDTPALEYTEVLLGKGGRGNRQAGLPLPGQRRPGRFAPL